MLNLFKTKTPDAEGDGMAELQIRKLREARDDAQTRYNRAKTEADRVRANPASVSAAVLQAVLVDEQEAAEVLDVAQAEYEALISSVERKRQEDEHKQAEAEKADKVAAYEKALSAYRQAASALVQAAPKVRELGLSAGVYMPDWQGDGDLLFDSSAEPHILGQHIGVWHTA